MKSYFLYETLGPLCKMTHYLGILPDWCYFLNKGRDPGYSIIQRVLVIMVALITSYCMTAFEFFQTMLAICSWKGINELVLYFEFLLPFFQTSLILSVFLLRRDAILDFFKRFHMLERELILPISKIQTISIIIYIMYALTGLLTLAGVISMTLQPPVPFNGTLTYNAYYPYYYKFLRDMFSVDFLKAFQIIAFIFVILYQILSDMVPAFVYYHSGIVLQAINDEVREAMPLLSASSSKDDQGEKQNGHAEAVGYPLQQVWLKYTKFRILVKTADRLFGPLVLVDYACKFFMICAWTYSVLGKMRNIPVLDFSIPLCIGLSFLARLVWGIMFKSYLNENYHRFMFHLGTWEHKYWYDLSQEGRKLLATFHDHVHDDPMSASPMRLFDVNPSLLLTMLSLAVSYLIILLQCDLGGAVGGASVLRFF